jgi:HEAT repeat protein
MTVEGGLHLMAIKALGELPQEQALPLLLASMTQAKGQPQSQEPALRAIADALLSLGSSGVPVVAMNALLELMQVDSTPVRLAAATGLVHLLNVQGTAPTPEMRTLLATHAASDPDSDVRKVLAQARHAYTV